VQLAITTEGVTQIIVEEFLPWLGPYPETPLLQKIEPTDFSFEAKMQQGDFLQGN
jgi:hypothetical protein